MSSGSVEADFELKEVQPLILAELEDALKQDPTLLEASLDIQRASSLRTEVPVPPPY